MKFYNGSLSSSVVNIKPSFELQSNESANQLPKRALTFHDVIKWTHFPRDWPFVPGIHRSPVNSPQKGQWCGTLMFSLIWAWTNGWVNICKAGDLRRHRAHYDATVMYMQNGDVVWRPIHYLNTCCVTWDQAYKKLTFFGRLGVENRCVYIKANLRGLTPP